MEMEIEEHEQTLKTHTKNHQRSTDSKNHSSRTVLTLLQLPSMLLSKMVDSSLSKFLMMAMVSATKTCQFCVKDTQHRNYPFWKTCRV
ncbi:hypothetical protein C5167_048874 [Papaver somniferum]|uniref:Uncharacterized protein n=1 Tax=Papaver somniferum TaxID=3469 RepID=A0A4Y7KJ74_PAPSO|nr:hypothetical protein C5167_048874 [Papaver somniferum]